VAFTRPYRRPLPVTLSFALCVHALGCAEATYSPIDCPALPTYDLEQARAFAEAGVPATSNDPPYAWLSASERRVLEEAARLGCITLPQRGYSLGASTLSQALPSSSAAERVSDAGVGAHADSGSL
jgi:hypothetical protein